MSNITKSKMKAALLYGPRDLRVEEVDRPVPHEDEILARVKAIGICPSDVRSYEGTYKRQMFPAGKESYGLSGHEWSGEIVEVGSAVKDFVPGDRVVPEIIVPCGICRFCREGVTNLCASKKNIVRGYAEYAIVPSRMLYRVPANVSFEAAAFCEPIAVCIHANEIISPEPGDFVLIVGGGPMGLLHTQISKLSGATVMLSEVIESRLTMAKDFQADAVINPTKEDLAKKVKELTGGYGADAVIVAAGSKGAIESAFKAVAPTGTIVLFGGSYPPVTVEFDPNIIHYGEIKVTGSYDHIPAHMERALKLLSQDAINVEKLISNTFELSSLKEAFELVKTANALKVNVIP
jgi:L-iditol 2-dehydrogenase